MELWRVSESDGQETVVPPSIRHADAGSNPKFEMALPMIVFVESKMNPEDSDAHPVVPMLLLFT